MHAPALPIIIQGGMGAGVSDWRLARAVSMTGQLGVVSGTALDAIMPRRLQMGDTGGHVRRALAHFPFPKISQRILDLYFVSGGKPEDKPFKSKPMPSESSSRAANELIVASNFVEVYLAKEGHARPVGINYLEKIQLPTLPSLYGAMLAGVSYVLMGAGIPRAIPGILDRLSRLEAVELSLDVHDATADDRYVTRFDPAEFRPQGTKTLQRPEFYAIVSSATLATVLARKSCGKVNGFIVEGPTAGGHNAPPRGPMQLNAIGEPIYGPRDDADLGTIKSLGLPFWLAGSYARPQRVAEAIEHGATGVQVGTAFAFCDESGMDRTIKDQVLAMSAAGNAKVITDPVASPTGFPFKILQLPGSQSDLSVANRRLRICDLGYLRHAYKKSDGTLGWRCPAEPIDIFVQKGGDIDGTHGRLCVCNGLTANIGFGQVRGGQVELPLVTSGDDVADVARFLKPGATSYSAADVVEYLLGSGSDETRDPSIRLMP